MKCKNCGVQNLDGTNYCQNCGSKLKLKSSGSTWGNFKIFAGLGHKGSSIAPLAAMSIENQGKSMGEAVVHRNLVKVCPLRNGQWYRPDCGELNEKYTSFCKSCGRDFV